MSQKKRAARPLSVTFTVWGVFFLGTANVWGAVRIWQQAPLLVSMQTTMNPWLRAVMALVFGGLFLNSAWALHRRRPWVRRGLPLISALFALYQISVPLLFARSELARQGLPANVLLYFLFLLFVAWVFYRPVVRRYLEIDP